MFFGFSRSWIEVDTGFCVIGINHQHYVPWLLYNNIPPFILKCCDYPHFTKEWKWSDLSKSLR